jgi:Cdc6-like AAA superfamily ATPase
MLHSHTFAPTRRSRFLPRIPDANPLSPGAYLQRRRKAAGLEIRDLASRLSALRNALIEARELPAGALAIRQDFVKLIIMLEAKGVRARHPETLEAIAAVMPFDAAVYQQLAYGNARRQPRVCRGCGCSTHDSCQDEQWGSCSWASPTQCSHCAAKGAGTGILVIYGPQGSGKTLNAEALAQHYERANVIDTWEQDGRHSDVRHGDLVLTSAPVNVIEAAFPNADLISIEDALEAIGVTAPAKGLRA